MIVKNSNQAEEAADNIEETLGQPISTASHFYTLYYLTQQKEVDELEFDFFKLKDRLADDFLNYATAVISEELHHISDEFKIKLSVSGQREVPPFDYSKAYSYAGGLANHIDPESSDRREALSVRRATTDLMEREAEKNLSNESADTVKRIATVKPLEPEYNVSITRVGSMISKAISNAGAFVDNESFLEAAQFLFGHDWLHTEGEIVDGMEATVYFHGWTQDFGGEAWANVAETAKYYYEMSDEAFIDLMFSIEHNNGNFLNKTESEYAEDQKNLQMSDRAKTKMLARFSPTPFVKDILPLYLDLAKDGDIAPLYDIAISVDPQLRGYGHLIPEQKRVPVISADPEEEGPKLVPVDEAGVEEWTKTW